MYRLFMLGINPVMIIIVHRVYVSNFRNKMCIVNKLNNLMKFPIQLKFVNQIST